MAASIVELPLATSTASATPKGDMAADPELPSWVSSDPPRAVRLLRYSPVGRPPFAMAIRTTLQIRDGRAEGIARVVSPCALALPNAGLS